VEFTIVAAIGALIVLSLSTFYLNAQSMWLDSSVQAVTQRDATLFVEHMEQVIGGADEVVVTTSPTSHLALFRQIPGSGAKQQIAAIDWNSGAPHATITRYVNGSPVLPPDTWPATGNVRALQFRIEGPAPNARVVYLDSLCVDTPAGEPLFMSTCFALYNKP